MYINRQIESKIKKELMNYKKPIFLNGARQVGKTTMLKKILNDYNYLYINLFTDQETNKIFDEQFNLDYQTLINKIELIYNIKKDNIDIIYIDEIQVNEIAFASLKTFNESGDIKVITSGSNVAPTLFGNRKVAFPVGQFIEYELYPLSFSEFLKATDNEIILTNLIESLNNKQIDQLLHKKTLEVFDEYLQVGGMPDVVKSYINNEDYYNVQKTLFDNYVNDFAKYGNDKDIKYLKSIYDQIPQMLGKQNQIFVSTDTGYKSDQLKSSYDWLQLSKMVVFCYKITTIKRPLEANIKTSKFKLFLNDTGLLVSKMGYTVKKHAREADNIYMGEICENYIATVLCKYTDKLTYFHDKIEVDFVQYFGENLVALEIKASTNTKSKSLTSFINKFNPEITYKLSRKNLEFSTHNHMPLYAIDIILENNIASYFE